jgi:hypothetical protein
MLLPRSGLFVFTIVDSRIKRYPDKAIKNRRSPEYRYKRSLLLYHAKFDGKCLEDASGGYHNISELTARLCALTGEWTLIKHRLYIYIWCVWFRLNFPIVLPYLYPVTNGLRMTTPAYQIISSICVYKLKLCYFTTRTHFHIIKYILAKIRCC